MIDLRSDTVTRPTPAMRAVMAAAEVDDDVIDIDPTVARLQERTAELLGKEAAIFMPSGSMTNQVAVRIHCKPGDEFLCDEGCHIFHYEQGAFAQLSGVVARTVAGKGGVLELSQLEHLVRPLNEHLTRTRMVTLENTHNRGAGRVLPFEVVESISQWARTAGLAMHLDGARLFNAVVASGISADRWADLFDTVSVCFSKGLGAPVGSALVGPRDLIDEARYHRKLFGGAMRQAGIIAAGALHAVENHRQRLVEDHQNAQTLAQAVRQATKLELCPDSVDTNIVIFHVDPSMATAGEFAAALKQAGVRTLGVGATLVRAVTHHDVSADQTRQAAEIIKQVADDYSAGRIEIREHEPSY